MGTNRTTSKAVRAMSPVDEAIVKEVMADEKARELRRATMPQTIVGQLGWMVDECVVHRDAALEVESDRDMVISDAYIHDFRCMYRAMEEFHDRIPKSPDLPDPTGLYSARFERIRQWCSDALKSMGVGGAVYDRLSPTERMIFDGNLDAMKQGIKGGKGIAYHIMGLYPALTAKHTSDSVVAIRNKVLRKMR